jgi:hypothetical protein
MSMSENTPKLTAATRDLATAAQVFLDYTANCPKEEIIEFQRWAKIQMEKDDNPLDTILQASERIKDLAYDVIERR